MSDKENRIEFKGVIKRRVYDSPDFKIYAVEADKLKYPSLKFNIYKNVTVMGELPDLIIENEYEFTVVEKETKHGISYKCINVRRDLPTTFEETKTFLSEILTEAQAEVLMAHYPDIVQRVKNNDCDTIDFSKLRGIKEKTFEKIKVKIIRNYCLFDLVSEFGNVISIKMLSKIYDKYPSINKLRTKLKTEPYTTLTRISGIGFKKADAIVLELQNQNIIDFECDIKTSADRCLAAILYLLDENENNGNTKANLIELRKEIIKLVPECVHHFTEAIKNEYIYYNKDKLEIASKKTYESEKYVAEQIKYGLSVNKKWDFDWKSYQNKGEFGLSDEQIEFLHAVCDNNIVILTGGAGMGKSFSTEMLIQMLNDNSKTYITATPTGKSAKVLKDFSKTDAKTIHRALMYNPQSGWGYNKENKLTCDVLLLDELSMVSIDLMEHVIDAIDFNKTKLVMIGDPNQLPSVGAGNILHDLISNNIIPVVRLTKVFRYGSGGILTAATDIINGKKYIPNDKNKIISMGTDGGYTFIKANDDTIIDEALALYKRLITTGMNGIVYNPEDIAVLTAYNKGDYGAVALNKRLQQIANKNYGSEVCLKSGDNVFYLNDIVMQIQNNYSVPVHDEEDEEAFVANGECSKVITMGDKYLVADYDGVKVRYDKEILPELSLSYSYTIHKSQGSTIKIVIVISPRSHVYMSTMNLLYVGVTRASDKCFHFGLPSTIDMAIKKRENFNRLTFLGDLLK